MSGSSNNSSSNPEIIRGRCYRQDKGVSTEYVRDYGVYSLIFFITRMSVSFNMDLRGRFAFCGDDPRSPMAIFVLSGVENDEVMAILAEDYGLDIKLID